MIKYAIIKQFPSLFCFSAHDAEFILVDKYLPLCKLHFEKNNTSAKHCALACNSVTKCLLIVVILLKEFGFMLANSYEFFHLSEKELSGMIQQVF